MRKCARLSPLAFEKNGPTSIRMRRIQSTKKGKPRQSQTVRFYYMWPYERSQTESEAEHTECVRVIVIVV